MAAIPAPTNSTVRKIYELHEAKRDNTARPYLGASELGEPCGRRLWLRFRWASVEAFEGRMLRLFDTGNREESRLLDELAGIGCTVEGQQHEVEFADGHGKGRLDAMVLGLEEAPKSWHVVDVKTAKTSKFAEMQKKGAGAVYPKYAAQMQLYMGLTGVERAAFFLICKETDEIAIERLHFDQAEFDRLLAKAAAIIDAPEPPARISEDATWHECRYCPFHAQCHSEARPAVNCRTCAHSTPIDNGEWMCDVWADVIPLDAQRTGCDKHRYIPVLLERVAELQDVDGERLKWTNKLTGKTFMQPDYSSQEMFAAADFRVIGDDFMESIKEVFGADSRVTSGPGPAVMPADPAMPDDLEPIYGKAAKPRARKRAA